MTNHSSPLLVHPTIGDDQPGEYIRVTPESAGWETLSFAARRLRRSQSWQHETGANELALVVLGGVCSVRSSRGDWLEIGRRANVFSGMPYALYLPSDTSYTVEAISDDLDIAYGWAEARAHYPSQLIRPADVHVEIRGGDNVSRQINDIIPPGFNCDRLVVVEVFTPSGNWSSYPPHKHDEHREDAAGNLLEADLEEVYFYKINPPEGYAYQRVYTGDGRLDELVLACTNNAVLVPEGYHPVVSAPGYTTYYLNFLAGSAQSLANTDDPTYAWVKDTYVQPDPRLPVVSMEMER